jgi:hypothetical protein
LFFSVIFSMGPTYAAILFASSALDMDRVASSRRGTIQRQSMPTPIHSLALRARLLSGSNVLPHQPFVRSLREEVRAAPVTFAIYSTVRRTDERPLGVVQRGEHIATLRWDIIHRFAFEFILPNRLWGIADRLHLEFHNEFPHPGRIRWLRGKRTANSQHDQSKYEGTDLRQKNLLSPAA